jgi:hypothetical protein
MGRQQCRSSVRRSVDRHIVTSRNSRSDPEFNASQRVSGFSRPAASVKTTEEAREHEQTLPPARQEDAACLLVDRQAQLLSLVRDIDPDRFKNNVLVLADLAKDALSREPGPK